MRVNIEKFGVFNGQIVEEIFVTNSNDITVSFLTLGARINRFIVKDENIILGFDSMDKLLNHRELYYGATIGPVSGRIVEGHFSLNGQEYFVDKNEGDNHLHGGVKGYDWQNWDFEILEAQKEIKFYLRDQSANSGYPSDINVSVIHTFNDKNEWTVTYEADSEAETIFDPTNHVYFNLNGNQVGTIEDHYLQVNANYYYPVADDVTPRANMEAVENTPFDFRKKRKIGDAIQADHEQIRKVKGIDHPFVFGDGSPQVELIAPLKSRKIIIETDAPGAVIYTHNKVDTEIDIWGTPLKPYAGIAIEPQILLGNSKKLGVEKASLSKKNKFLSQTKYSYIEE